MTGKMAAKSKCNTECCVPLCTNKGGHKFPWKDRKLMEAWIKSVKRDDWDTPKRIIAAASDDTSPSMVKGPSRFSVVCSSHFEDEDYLHWTFDGTKPLIRRLRKRVVPHIFPWQNVQDNSAAISRRARALKRKCQEAERDSACSTVAAFETVACEEGSTSIASSGTQTEPPSGAVSTSDKATRTELERISIHVFNNDAEGLLHYTGMDSYERFMLLFKCLGPSVNSLTYFSGTVPLLSPPDQLLVTLVKLRCTLDDFEICRKLNISQVILTNIFITWVNFLALQFEEMGFWPSRDLVSYYAPQDFYLKYPTTRAVVDGTECPIAKPKEPIAQQCTFSHYKNRNTLKVITGTTPGGLVSYCSDAYGGSSSDRQIVERGDLTSRCDPGDSLMADKGFNVDDLFESKDVQINIPKFFKKKNRLSNKTIKSDRQIASKRVHVERVIGLAKTFKILKHPFNNTQSALGTQIIKVCFYLCNFRNCIVSKSA